MKKVVNIARGIVAGGFVLIALWYGILAIIWNIGFFDNFLPGIVAVILGILFVESLPIIFIVSWVLYGFSSVTPLLVFFGASFAAMFVGIFLYAKGRVREKG